MKGSSGKKSYIYAMFLVSMVVLAYFLYHYIVLSSEAQIKSTSDTLEKQIQIRGRIIETQMKEFEEDIDYNIEIGTFTFKNQSGMDEINHLRAIKRFYSKYQSLISSIILADEQHMKVITKTDDNYIHVTDEKSGRSEYNKTLQTKITTNGSKLEYAKAVTDERGIVVSNVVILVDLHSFIANNLKELYVAKKAWYWLVREDGNKEKIYSSYKDDANISGMDKYDEIVKKIKTGYSGVLSHSIDAEQSYQVLSAYYPLKTPGHSIGIVVSVSQEEVLGALNDSVRTIVISFALLLAVALLLFWTIIRSEKASSIKLVKSEDTLKNIIQFLPVGIVVYDSEKRIKMINNALQKLAEDNQQTVHDLMGRKVDDVIKLTLSDNRDQNNAENMHKYLLRTMDGEVAATAEGKEIQVLKKSSLIEIGGEEHTIEVVVDIESLERARLEAEKAKQQAEEANVAKSQFLANMSHEIRTPMNGIMGFIELLSRTELNQEQRDFVQETKKVSLVLMALINDILDLSKIEAGKVQIENIDFNLHAIIEDAASLAAAKANEKGVEVFSMIYSNVPDTVNGDPGKLRQVLNNLVSNAVKFTEKGEVTLTANTISEDDVNIQIQIDVIDTGIGIEADMYDKLFEAFTQADASTTRKYGGTGLGLAISKQLVNYMEGDIWINSEYGKGSTFSFTVKFKKSNDKKTLSEPLVSMEGTSIMVVDDNDSSRKILKEYLNEIGANIVETESGALALSKLIFYAGSAKMPDIVILNNHLHDMNGFEFAKTIKSIGILNEVKMIMITSTTSKGDAKQACEAGLAGYLSIPIKKKELKQSISMILGGENLACRKQDTTREGSVKDNGFIKSKKILLVEDNEINWKVTTKMLTQFGMECDLCTNGADAVEVCKNKKYDIILMDCQMPVLDGYAATAKIRLDGINKKTPVIAMTANALEGDQQKCLEAGMTDYLSKPLEINSLIATIDKY